MYIESQQAILSATQFVIEMNRFVKDPQASPLPHVRMQELHERIDHLVEYASGKPHEGSGQTVDAEATAARALRCMSVVKLNR